MTGNSEQIQAIMARYRLSLAEKATQIEQRSKMMSECTPAELEEHLRECHSELHKLAGSSGMYGYDDICELSRHIMQSIDDKNMLEVKEASAKLRDLLIQYGQA